eukprot:TRINITY_DN1075_c0_g4_i1.p1 TRINITY_DN1075_c0_g4~~TRINITY_DN1075_c0_g4_i1.p1  ORF type:complete len:275 (+),score=58.76 TRINITY_DN1075_c0_g4_i1:78-902(+)
MTYGRPIFTNFDQPLVENEFMDASAPMDYQMVVAQSDSYEEKHRKLNAVLAKHKVSVAQGDQLFQLTEMKITFICDDSGSMNMSADTKKYTHSRWKELQETVMKFLEITVYLVPSVDVHFLNRPSVLNIKDWNDPRIAQAFREKPRGSTPLVATLREKVMPRLGIKNLLLIATDGAPDEGVDEFKYACTSILSECKIQILACTDNKKELRWLDALDKKFEEIDVMDDYEAEKKQILRKGRVRSFNKADYVVKGLLGPVCKNFDKMDEQGCCSLM